MISALDLVVLRRAEEQLRSDPLDDAGWKTPTHRLRPVPVETLHGRRRDRSRRPCIACGKRSEGGRSYCRRCLGLLSDGQPLDGRPVTQRERRMMKVPR